MRLFYAITFKEESKVKLSIIRDALADHALKGRFISKDNIHLTLAFIGEVNQSKLNDYESVIDYLNFDDLQLKATHLGSFRKKNKDILWLGLEDERSVKDLNNNLVKILSTLGLAYEKRKYHPHITMGRQVVMDSNDIIVPPVDLKLDSIALMHSHRVNDILVYEPIYQRQFNNTSLT